VASEQINFVTAISRPENLERIHRSIELAISRASLKVRWILVADGPEVIWPSVESSLRSGKAEIEKVVYSGPRLIPYGIVQKNLGMDTILDGYYHCLDDDNVVHPEFLAGLERAMNANPEARAFVVGQQRWDGVGNLIASPVRMGYGQIDNTMFVVHRDVIGSKRYDPGQPGLEDFYFFSELWGAYPNKFAFIRETLAYYNYIRVWPVETAWEPIRQVAFHGGFQAPELQPTQNLPATSQAPLPVPAPLAPSVLSPLPKRHPYYPEILLDEPRRPGSMKIALYSSKLDRCGISTYTSNLADALTALGHEVQYFSSQPPYEPRFQEILAWKPDVFHFQHETSIMPGGGEIARFSAMLRQNGSKIFITLHTDGLENINIARSAGPIILHRPSQYAPDAHILPMPCTNAPSLPEKIAARRHFGFPDSAFVISTVGFMIPWKEHPKILELMIPWIRSRPDVHLQLIASAHFNSDLQGYAHLCRQQIAQIAAGSALSDRIHHVDSYPSDRELVNRLSMSDLGYVWCPFDTASASAAGSQFVSAKCPLVATDSSHYATLGDGVVRSRKESMSEFIQLIQKTAEDLGLLDRLRSNHDAVYAARNYTETARKHLMIYRGEV
jgi:hypothetical protein